MSFDITTVLRDHGIGVGKKPKGTAVPADVLAGKTFMNVNGEQTGAMANRSTGNYASGTPTRNVTTLELPIPANAYYGTGAKITRNEPNWKPENISDKVTMFGLQGSLKPASGITPPPVYSIPTGYVIQSVFWVGKNLVTAARNTNTSTFTIHRIEFDENGTMLSNRLMSPSEDVARSFGSSIKVTEDNIYAHDGPSYKIYKYDKNGTLLKTTDLFRGGGEGYLIRDFIDNGVTDLYLSQVNLSNTVYFRLYTWAGSVLFSRGMATGDFREGVFVTKDCVMTYAAPQSNSYVFYVNRNGSWSEYPGSIPGQWLMKAYIFR